MSISLALRVQFRFEVEATARCYSGVDGHSPSFPERDRDT